MTLRERERVLRLFLNPNLGNVFPNVSVLVSLCFLNCGFVRSSLFMIFYHVFLWLHGKSSTISSIDCYYQGMKWMAMKHEVQLDDKHVIALGNHMKSNLEHLRHARDSIKLSD